MTAVFHLSAYVDLDPSVETKVVESLVATAIAQYMANNGFSQNVMVRLEQVLLGISIASFFPDAAQPVTVASAGTSTWIGAPAAVAVVKAAPPAQAAAPVFISSGS